MVIGLYACIGMIKGTIYCSSPPPPHTHIGLVQE